MRRPSHERLTPTVVPFHPHGPPIWQTCLHFYAGSTTEKLARPSALAIASTPATRAPAACGARTDSAAVAPVVTMSSTSGAVFLTGRRRRPGGERCAGALWSRIGANARRRAHPQSGDDVDAVDVALAIAIRATGRRRRVAGGATGGGGHESQRHLGDAPADDRPSGAQRA